MSRNAKVVTEEVETLNEELPKADTHETEVVTAEVETLSEDTSGQWGEPTPNDWIDGKRPEGEYNCLVNIKRNGILYSPWEKIMLDTEEAQILLADKSIF